METLIERTVVPRVDPAGNHPDHGGVGVDAVVVKGLTKRYGNRAAVDNLSFTVPAGSVAGLIGPNGAGKTTLMAMLLGLVRPSAGSGTVLGRSVDRPPTTSAVSAPRSKARPSTRPCRVSTTCVRSPCSAATTRPRSLR